MSNVRLVEFWGGTETIAGFLALPPRPGPHRAIIAIHEWWGLTTWVKEQVMNLAANAYVVLALDLYQGKVTTNSLEARKLKRDLPEERAIRAMKAAFDYLACRSDVDSQHISSLGWSMGGALALQLAINEPRLAACVVNYGALPTSLADIQKINARTLGIFGSLDRGIPRHKVRAFEKRMNAVHKPIEIIIYEGAGHAFENCANKRAYRPHAAADAWLRTLTFLNHSRDVGSLLAARPRNKTCS
jgi:carboxymethylenebutenolidase